MKKLILMAMLLSTTAYAKHNNGYFLKVSGMDALKNQGLNQYDDVNNPPQAFDITLPKGYSLSATDVDSGGVSICSVTSYDRSAQRLTIEALEIETDAGACVVTLTIFRAADKKEIKVQYSIEQTGT